MTSSKRTSTVKTPSVKRRNWAKRATLVVLGAFAVNSLAVAAGTPWVGDLAEAGGKDGALISQWMQQHPGVELTIAESISPSSLIQVPSTGTISLLGEDSMYIAPPSQHGDWRIGYILSHEYHHVQQINLVQDITNMTPSIWNPIATAAHLGTFSLLNLELNNIYGQDWASTQGIEISADCYSAWVERQEVGYEGQAAYTHVNECTAEEIAASIAVSDGVWPSAENIQARVAEAEELMSIGDKIASGSNKPSVDK